MTLALLTLAALYLFAIGAGIAFAKWQVASLLKKTEHGSEHGDKP